jgi:hypothetical protein
MPCALRRRRVREPLQRHLRWQWILGVEGDHLLLEPIGGHVQRVHCDVVGDVALQPSADRRLPVERELRLGRKRPHVEPPRVRGLGGVLGG